MKSKLTINPITAELQKISTLPELEFDPRSPAAEDAWVLKRQLTQTARAGSPIMCGFLYTYAEDVTVYRRDLSFRTRDGRTLRVQMEEDEPYIEAAPIETEDGEEITTEGAKRGTPIMCGMLYTYPSDQEGQTFTTEDGIDAN